MLHGDALFMRTIVSWATHSATSCQVLSRTFDYLLVSAMQCGGRRGSCARITQSIAPPLAHSLARFHKVHDTRLRSPPSTMMPWPSASTFSGLLCLLCYACLKASELHFVLLLCRTLQMQETPPSSSPARSAQVLARTSVTCKLAGR